MADDLGYGEVGFNGQTKIKTPNLDKMAEEGMNLTNFYAGAPVCGPSRATFLYGLHSGHAPIRGNPKWSINGRVNMKPDDMILPKELKRAGYATAIFGKWGMNEDLEGDTGNPLKQGFDEFVGFNTHVEAHYHWPDFYWDGNEKVDLSQGETKGNFKKRYKYADDIFTEKALDFIDRKSTEKVPFFLFLAYTIPHKGYTAPAASRKVYEKLDWPKRKGVTGHYEYDDEVNSAFAGMISHMDAYIAEIRSKLVEKGVDKNTMIFFTGDNGHEYFGDFFDSNGPFTGKKRDVTEGGIRIPTVVVWPGKIKANTKLDSALALWDLYPTFCDLADVSPQINSDGISFVPALQGKRLDGLDNRVLYWEFNEGKGPQQAIRFGKWKAIRRWDSKQNQMGQLQLFDLNRDKAEKNNLAGQYPEVASEALKKMLAERTDHPNYPLRPLKGKGNKKKNQKTKKK